jgi:hypothetical protein
MDTTKKTPKGKSDAELGFIDDVPVVRADGSETTLGEIDPSPVEDAPAKGNGNGKGNGKPSAKAQQSQNELQRLKGKAAAKTEALREKQTESTNLAKARTASTKTLEKVERALARLTDPAHEGYRKQVTDAVLTVRGLMGLDDWAKLRGADDILMELLRGVNDEVKRVKAVALEEKAAARKEREAKAEEGKAEREAKAAERAAAKLARQGLTGDEETDAALLASWAEADTVSKALAIAPAPTQALDFLVADGVRLTTTGLVLADNLAPKTWANVLGRLVSLADVNQFAIGDALIYGFAHYPENVYDSVRATYNLGYSTVKNYKSVSGAWPVEERVEGVGFAFHREAAALYRKEPAVARNLLEQVRQEGRNLKWLVDQVKVATGEDLLPTPAQKRLAVVNALIEATDEMRDEDLEQYGNDERAVAKAHEAELVALAEYVQMNDYTPSATVIRNVAWLNARVHALETENRTLRERLAAYEQGVTYRTEANARIIDGEAEVVDAAPYLDGLAEPSDEDLASEGDVLASLLDEDAI